MHLAIPSIQWVGIFPSELKNWRHETTRESFVKISEYHKKRIEDLSYGKFVQHNPNVKQELREMIETENGLSLSDLLSDLGKDKFHDFLDTKILAFTSMTPISLRKIFCQMCNETKINFRIYFQCEECKRFVCEVCHIVGCIECPFCRSTLKRLVNFNE